jgi:ABC-type multidrug transport system fused ATPase/permease subunit
MLNKITSFTNSIEIGFILESIKEFKIWIFGFIIFAILLAFQTTLSPYMLKIMFDTILRANKNNIIKDLIYPINLYLGLCIFKAFLMAFYDYIWLNLKSKMQEYIGTRLNKRIMSYDMEFFHNNLAGSLVNKINDAMKSTPNIIRIFFEQIFGNLITLLISLYILYNVKFVLALSFLVWAIVFITLSLRYSQRAEKLSHKAAEVRSRLVGNETL